MVTTFPAVLVVEAVALGALGRRLRSRFYGTMCVLWVGGAAAWWAADLPNGWGVEPSGGLVVAAVISSAVILYRFATAKPVGDVTPAPTTQ
jgi:hypothetical protein